MYREVTRIDDDAHGKIILAVTFGQLDEPVLIQPMTENMRCLGNDFPFDHQCTKGNSLQSRANNAILHEVYGKLMKTPDCFMPILIMHC